MGSSKRDKPKKPEKPPSIEVTGREKRRAAPDLAEVKKQLASAPLKDQYRLILRLASLSPIPKEDGLDDAKASLSPIFDRIVMLSQAALIVVAHMRHETTEQVHELYKAQFGRATIDPFTLQPLAQPIGSDTPNQSMSRASETA